MAPERSPLAKVRHKLSNTLTPLIAFLQAVEIPRDNEKLANLREICLENIAELQASLKEMGE